MKGCRVVLFKLLCLTMVFGHWASLGCGGGSGNSNCPNLTNSDLSNLNLDLAQSLMTLFASQTLTVGGRPVNCSSGTRTNDVGVDQDFSNCVFYGQTLNGKISVTKTQGTGANFTMQDFVIATDTHVYTLSGDWQAADNLNNTFSASFNLNVTEKDIPADCTSIQIKNGFNYTPTSFSTSTLVLSETNVQTACDFNQKSAADLLSEQGVKDLVQTSCK
ncbi:MAG: hypothetical protein U1F57_08220 [bacterium]